MMQPRDLMQWLLYSRARVLGVAVAVVLVLVGAWALTRPSEAPPTRSAPAAPAPGPSPSATPSPTPTASPTVDAALDTARRFVTVWASHQKIKPWLAELKPLTTPRLLGALATTDPDNIGAHRVLSVRAAMTGDDETTQAAVKTDDGMVSVSLTWDRSAGRWRVYDIQPGAQPEAG